MQRRFTALAVALAVVLTGCARARSGDVRDGRGGSHAIEIVMHDGAFAPDTLELEAGTTVDVEATNAGTSRHDFTIDALDLSTGTTEPGGVVTATFRIRNGRTGFRCTFHPEMSGVIRAV